MSDYEFSVVSTFSGCGGSSLGYKLAGGKILLAVEYDKNAALSYQLNFPTTPVFADDIHNLSVDRILEITQLKSSELDIFDGSPPCQGFSQARGVTSPNDKRNQLYFQYVRILKGLLPKCFVMENVSGMIKGRMKGVYHEIYQALVSCGYRVKSFVLNAASYSVPQTRPRIFFIGVRNDFDFEITAPIAHKKSIALGEALLNVPTSTKYFLNSKFRMLWENTRPGANFTDASIKILKKHQYFNTHRCDWFRPAPTITKQIWINEKDRNSATGGSICHPNEPRPFTIAELKRIATFPDEFQLSGNFRQQWGCIGNCVPPLLMKAVASHIRETILAPAYARQQQPQSC
jgi:DNA (cytosine-5)-methyltransferase 1